MAEQSDLPLRGSGFNTDPQTGDWDQLSFENHSLNERVRGENTDTDDAYAIYVQGVSTTTKVFNVLKTGAVWVASQNLAGLSASTNITLGAAAAAGTGTAALRSDATILAYDGTAPSPVGSVASSGSASLAARRDHYHLGVTSIAASGNAGISGAVNLYAGSNIGLSQIADGIQIEATTASSIPSSGVPALVLGTVNAAGAASSFIASDASVLVYDGNMPTSQVIGDAAATGTAAVAARRDHKHAIANTNVSLAGGSWGSGPIFVNPQIAATGWASANHAHAAANSGGTISVALGFTYNAQVGDVSMPSANLAYDSASLTLGAGTWALDGGMLFLMTTSGGAITGKLWDGSTVYDSSELSLQYVPAANPLWKQNFHAVVVLAGSTNVKLTALATQNGNTIKAQNLNNSPSTNTASQLFAVKIA